MVGQDVYVHILTLVNFLVIQFMHNGGIADFPLIKRRLQADLSDDVFNVVQGNTGEYNTRPKERIVTVSS